MKLLFVTSALPPGRLGGAETYALELADVLAQRGFVVDVLGRASDGHARIETLEHGRRIHVASPMHAYFGFLSTAARWLHAHAADYDVIQFFDMNHLTGVGLRVTRNSGVCRVARVEGVLRWCDEQLFATGVSVLARATYKWLRTADRYVVASSSEARELEADGVPAEHITFVPNGVDLADFSPRPFTSDPVIVCPARLRPEKNHVGLLQAFVHVRGQVPDARLVFVGDGPAEPAIRAEIDRLGLGGAVDLPGHVERMADLFATCRIAVLLSTAEGPALGVLEAAACGRPAVVSRIGGLVDSVRDGETGFVVESGDVAGAADAMVRLLTDDALCTRMGEAAGTFVAAERSLDAAADRYVELVRTWVAASDRKGSAS